VADIVEKGHVPSPAPVQPVIAKLIPADTTHVQAGHPAPAGPVAVHAPANPAPPPDKK
jgi:hypothetical protein